METFQITCSLSHIAPELLKTTLLHPIYEGRTESHEQQFFVK